MQDKLKHSEIVIGQIENLKYSYEQIHAAVTHRLTKDKKKLSTLVIGGGGYVFPRYIEKMWPGSIVDVVEIDGDELPLAAEIDMAMNGIAVLLPAAVPLGGVRDGRGIGAVPLLIDKHLRITNGAFIYSHLWRKLNLDAARPGRWRHE